jgi:hypothetical protein
MVVKVRNAICPPQPQFHRRAALSTISKGKQQPVYIAERSQKEVYCCYSMSYVRSRRHGSFFLLPYISTAIFVAEPRQWIVLTLPADFSLRRVVSLKTTFLQYKVSKGSHSALNVSKRRFWNDMDYLTQTQTIKKNVGQNHLLILYSNSYC